MKVFIEPVSQTGPNGDRDTQRHPYFDYRIHVADDAALLNDETVVHEVDGFNHFWTSIKPKDDVRYEAVKFAGCLAKRLGTVTEEVPADSASKPESALFTHAERAALAEIIKGQTGCGQSAADMAVHFITTGDVMQAVIRRVAQSCITKGRYEGRSRAACRPGSGDMGG